MGSGRWRAYGREPTPYDACHSLGQEISHCFLPVVFHGLHDSVHDLVGPGLAAGPADVAADGAVEVDQAVASRLVVQGQPVARTDFLTSLSAEQLPVEPGRRGPVEVNADGPGQGPWPGGPTSGSYSFRRIL